MRDVNACRAPSCTAADGMRHNFDTRILKSKNDPENRQVKTHRPLRTITRTLQWAKRKKVADFSPQRPLVIASKPKGLRSCVGIVKCARRHVEMKMVLSVIA